MLYLADHDPEDQFGDGVNLVSMEESEYGHVGTSPYNRSAYGVLVL